MYDMQRDFMAGMDLRSSGRATRDWLILLRDQLFSLCDWGDEASIDNGYHTFHRLRPGSILELGLRREYRRSRPRGRYQPRGVENLCGHDVKH